MSETDRQSGEGDERTGLSGLSSALLKDLSGGQQQRVFLGRAIIGDPGLLLLDDSGPLWMRISKNDFYENFGILTEKWPS